MRFLFLSCVLLVACSAKIEDEPNAAPADGTGTSAAPLCVPADPGVCARAIHATPDEPPRDGAVLWAQAAPGTGGKSAGVPKLAVYADGTLRRTPILRNLAASFTPPRGLVVARIAPASIERLRARAGRRRRDAAAHARGVVAHRADRALSARRRRLRLRELRDG